METLLQTLKRLNLNTNNLDFEQNETECRVMSFDFNFALVSRNNNIFVKWFDANQNEKEAKLTKSFEKKILGGWYQ